MNIYNISSGKFQQNAQSVLFAVLCIWIVAFTACGSKPNHTTISGEIKGGNNTLILLREAGDNSISTVDSTYTDANGKFFLSISVDEPRFFLLQVVGEPEPIVLLVEPKEEIEIVTEIGSMSYSYQVTGSKGSSLVKSLNLRLNKTVGAIDSLSYHFRSNREHPRFDSIKTAIDTAYNQLLRNHYAYSVNFVKENRYSLASILALYQQYNSKHQVFSKREDFNLFQLVDSSLYSLYPNNLLVANLHSNVKKMKKQFELYDRRKSMIDIGENLPDIDFPSASGEPFKFINFRARYILVDFWATWCNQCIPNNKQYKKIYADYQRKGFEIVQVSLDEDQNAFSKYIIADSITWRQAIDFKGWESPIVDSMQVSSIPANYLVDRYGVVVARNLNPKELMEFLGKNLP